SVSLSDGCRLAARIWLPRDAETDPVPAILEYLPYRKRDGTAERDQLTHPYFAGHGYACVRVDMRIGRIRRLARRRISEAGAGRLPGGDRVDRQAGVVHRQDRDDRNILGRLQRSPGGGPPAAAPPCGDLAL